MPSTLLGLLLLTVLALPGLAYVAIRERGNSARRPTAFRETATVVIAGLVSDLTALGVFALIRVNWPGGTPDVGRLIRDGTAYARVEYDRIALWSIGLLTLACVLAAIAAWAPARLARVRHPATLARWVRRWEEQRNHPVYVSAWWNLFVTRPQEMAAEVGHVPLAKVGVTLDDGRQYAGTLAWFNNSSDDVADRDLILTAPIHYKRDDTEAGQELDTHEVCLSARNITSMTVRYEEDPDVAPSEPEPAPDGEAGPLS